MQNAWSRDLRDNIRRGAARDKPAQKRPIVSVWHVLEAAGWRQCWVDLEQARQSTLHASISALRRATMAIARMHTRRIPARAHNGPNEEQGRHRVSPFFRGCLS